MTETLTIAEPGIYGDIPAEDYHRHDSLSSSGARRILPPSCPAAFRYGVREHKAAWDIGHAAHLRVLGEGPELVEVKEKDWRTKAAQQQRDEAYARDAVPLLTKDLAMVDAMAVAICEHDLASRLLEPESGIAEQSIFWEDPITEVMLRCRPDWRSPFEAIDYKTTISAEPGAISRTVHKFGYHQQAAFYGDGLRAHGLDLPFLFIFQEKTAPYLVTVTQLDDAALALGAELNRRAIDLYAACLAAGEWPGYSVDVVETSLPPYAYRDLEYSL